MSFVCSHHVNSLDIVCSSPCSSLDIVCSSLAGVCRSLRNYSLYINASSLRVSIARFYCAFLLRVSIARFYCAFLLRVFIARFYCASSGAKFSSKIQAI
jgi:hypothetical protein